MDSVKLNRMPDPAFWANQRVFLTGHTGFKGSWLSLWLEEMGAKVHGFSLPPDTDPSLFEMLSPFSGATSEYGDLREFAAVRKAAERFQPTVALHLAAQSLVRRSFREPLATFAVNVMGTANFLEALRGLSSLKSILVVTSDKVYRNHGTGHSFVESDPLGGQDPYSASKGAVELATASWAASYFERDGIAVATARAGNVIGGGDWSEDRLIPDLWRATNAGKPVELRYPNATRPWQHVLEPLSGYLVYLEKLTLNPKATPTALNFGPVPSDVLTVSQVADVIAEAFGSSPAWVASGDSGFAEMKSLSLDPGFAWNVLQWRPALTVRESLVWTANWYRSVREGADPRAESLAQVHAYTQKKAE